MLTFRNIKGSPLTSTELDANFQHYVSDKLLKETPISVTVATDPYEIPSPGGTPFDGQRKILIVLPTNPIREISWNAIFRFIGIPVVVSNKTSNSTYFFIIYNAYDSKWDILGVV